MNNNPSITSAIFNHKNEIKKIDDAAIKLLAANTTLIDLEISCCDLDNAFAIALAANTTLRTLNLSGNNINNEGATALAANTTLISLNIGWNRMRDAGVKALVAKQTLIDLDISSTEISNSTSQTLRNLETQKRQIQLAKLNAFLMGSHSRIGKNSSLLPFFKNDGRKDLTKKIFKFARQPFKLTW